MESIKSPPQLPSAATNNINRLNICTDLIAYSPPGELENVLRDLDILLSEHDSHTAFKQAVYPALSLYNINNYTIIPSHPKTLICPPAQQHADQFIDPQLHLTFTIDHTTLTLSNETKLDVDNSDEQFRIDLQALLDTYINQYYHQGIGTVYCKDNYVHLVHVSSKLNPSNFWNGHWKSYWVFDKEKGTLTGTLHAQVHFYEDGNIQLHFENQTSMDIPADSNPESIMKAITKSENQRHRALNDTYQKMNDSVFKNLRRALPLTKSKVDWNKMANYKIAAELSK